MVFILLKNNYDLVVLTLAKVRGVHILRETVHWYGGHRKRAKFAIDVT